MDIDLLFSAEARHRFVFISLLELCKTSRVFAEIEDECARHPEMKDCLFTANMLLEWLTNAGALTILKALQAKTETESKSDRWVTSDKGIAYLEEHSPKNELEKLIREKPEYKSVLNDMIEYCKTPKQLLEIDNRFSFDEVLKNDKVQVSYMIFLLENAGFVRWNDGWQTVV